MKFQILLLFIFSHFFQFSHSEHFTLTYHFWEKDQKLVEKAEFFTKFGANSNRFWTGNLNFQQENEKIDRIRIESENWKSANVEEIVEPDDFHNLDQFFSRIFQKFADKLYTNLALDSIPVFDDSIFTDYRHIYQDWEVTSGDNFWLKLGEDSTNQKYTFALLIRKRSFEHWEAVLHFVDAMKRTKQNGYILDCENEKELCNHKKDTENPILVAYFNEKAIKVFDGEYQKEEVHDWILTILQPPVTRLTEERVPLFRSGIVPGFPEPRETVTILFINTKNSQVWRNYKKYAKEVHGKLHLTAVLSKEVEKWSIYPAFITMKPRDEFVKAFTLHKNVQNYDKMVEFLTDGTHPSTHSLKTPGEFLYAVSPKKPLLIYFDPLNSKNSTIFRQAASQQQTADRNVHFAVISGFDLFGLYLMSTFNVNSASYVVLQRQTKGWCINHRPIEPNDFLQILQWTESLGGVNCQESVEDFKFPISRLHLLERYDDVAELEREHSKLEKNRDEL